MIVLKNQKLKDYLESFLTAQRIERMKEVLAQRTRYLTCVLEDLYDPRNGSAVIRHCEAFGVQEVHVIENKNNFKTDKQVDMGTAQWLDLHVYKRPLDPPPPAKSFNKSPEVLMALKQRGYRIVTTSPHNRNTVTPDTLNLSKGPVALVFGTEKHGVSEKVREHTDVFLHIPMMGFVESLNISASAAIVLQTLCQRLRKEKISWQLESSDAEEIYFRWVKNSVNHVESIIQHFENIPCR